MAKPLWRWTVGACLQQGLDILAESIVKTTKAMGIDAFDWAICYNGLTRENLEFIRKSIGDRPIQLILQNWADCPINDNCQSPRRKDGSFEWNGNRCGGTLWKVCPPRLRMNSHEIIMDNDIVILKKFPQIDEWLTQDKALVLEEPIRFYGRYDNLMPANEANLNSGFMGLPPFYDFGKEIEKNWFRNGSLMNLTQADEQGLLVYTLNQHPNMRIKSSQVVEILNRDFKTKVTGNEESVHFTQGNRMPNHYAWSKYKEIQCRQT